MAVQNFDSVNNGKRKQRHIPYEQWFGEIEKLGEQDVKDRIDMAKDFEDMILTYLSMMEYYISAGYGGDFPKGYLYDQYLVVVGKRFVTDEYVKQLAEAFSSDFHRVTVSRLQSEEKTAKRLQNSQNKGIVGTDTRTYSTDSSSTGTITDYMSGFEPETEDIVLGLNGSYWLSDDRAMLTAENLTLDIWNYEEFLDAISAGYTMKTWMTMGDNRVRDSHEVMDGYTITLDEVFHLDGGDMRFPRDAELGASEDEIGGCRCWLVYS